MLVGARLLLPDEWVKDPKRCRAAGIPDDRIKAASKADLARELMVQADDHGIQYARTGMESFYGRDSSFQCWLEARGTEYYADIPANTHIWLRKPEGGVRPASPGKHGATKVSDVSGSNGGWKKFKRIKIRDGENGPVMVERLALRVWTWPTGEAGARQSWLLISKDQGDAIKYTLSNAPSDTPHETLAKHQGQRHCIERNFSNSKSHLGMADSQLWVKKNHQWRRAEHWPSVSPVLAVAENGILLGGHSIWRNGQEILLDDLVANLKVNDARRFADLRAYAMNGDGAIVALATDASNSGSGNKALILLLPVELKAFKRGTLNTPGAEVPAGTGEFAYETVMMENADSESSATSTNRDCDESGASADLNAHRKANDDDLVKIVLKWPAGIKPAGASLKLLHIGMQVDATQTTADAAVSTSGASRLNFYKADGTRITNPTTDLQIADLANAPASSYLSKILTDYGIKLATWKAKSGKTIDNPNPPSSKRRNSPSACQSAPAASTPGSASG